METFDILVELLFIFLDSLMMHLMEISFLQKFIVSCLCFFRKNNCLFELAFQYFNFIFQNFVLEFCIRHIFSYFYTLVPLSLHIWWFTWKAFRVLFMPLLVKKFLIKSSTTSNLFRCFGWYVWGFSSYWEWFWVFFSVLFINASSSLMS